MMLKFLALTPGGGLSGVIPVWAGRRDSVF